MNNNNNNNKAIKGHFQNNFTWFKEKKIGFFNTDFLIK